MSAERPSLERFGKRIALTGTALLAMFQVACSKTEPARAQVPTQPQQTTSKEVVLPTSTSEPIVTPTPELTPTPEPLRFLEIVPVHSVFHGDIIEPRGDKTVKIGEMLVTRLHDGRIYFKSMRLRSEPCANGALRIINLTAAQNPSEYKKSPGVTVEAKQANGSFAIQFGPNSLDVKMPDEKTITGDISIAIPASGQKLCEDTRFQAKFKITGTNELIGRIAAMNDVMGVTSGIDYAKQSLEAVSGKDIPYIPTQKELVTAK